jgi:hypothetical protein
MSMGRGAVTSMSIVIKDTNMRISMTIISTNIMVNFQMVIRQDMLINIPQPVTTLMKNTIW